MHQPHPQAEDRRGEAGMKTLFPEMDKELSDDRMADRREKIQRARDHLRDRDFTWLINYLLEHGPQNECNLLLEYEDEDDINVLRDLNALWRVGKLWRINTGFHVGAGCDSFKFGIKGVHKKPKEGDA